MQVGEEDAAVLVDVQGGMSARDKPLGGLISTREERIVHFQKYIQSNLHDSGDGMDGGSQPSTLKMRQSN